MKVVREIARAIVGVVFILSGFLKAIDPVGTALKATEYMQAFGISSLIGISGFTTFAIVVALCLCVVEFVAGAGVLHGVKFRFFSLLSLLLSALFLIVTFISAIWNLVPDCGCFGEAIRLSTTATFLKNLILLALSLLMFLQRGKVERVANNFWEIFFVTLYTFCILCVALFALRNLPSADFSDFRPGTDLLSSADATPKVKYRTDLLYSKGNVIEKFTINDLPDSTWTFVDAITTVVAGSERVASGINLFLKDWIGQPVNESVLSTEEPLLLFSFYNRKGISEADLTELKAFADTLNRSRHRADLYIVSAMTPEETAEIFKIFGDISPQNESTIDTLDVDIPEYAGSSAVPFLYADLKALITLNRSNGGLTYVKEGEVIRKWSSSGYNYYKILAAFQEAPEVLVAKEQLHSKVFIEVSLIALLLIVLIFRFLSATFYKGGIGQISAGI